MSRSRVREPLEEVEELQVRLALWRHERDPGQRIPEELWSAAVGLAARHGVYAVARRLGLEVAKLKRLVQERTGQRPEEQERGPEPCRAAVRAAGRQEMQAGGFVQVDASELFGQSAPADGSAVLELLSSDGTRLKLSLNGRAALQLAAVVGALAGRG